MRRHKPIVYCFFLCVGHGVPRNRRTLTADIANRGFQNGTKFGTLIEGALLYITSESLEWKNSEGVKKICNAFLIHCLAKHDEIWHYDEHCIGA